MENFWKFVFTFLGYRKVSETRLPIRNQWRTLHKTISFLVSVKRLSLNISEHEWRPRIVGFPRRNKSTHGFSQTEQVQDLEKFRVVFTDYMIDFPPLLGNHIKTTVSKFETIFHVWSKVLINWKLGTARRIHHSEILNLRKRRRY